MPIQNPDKLSKKILFCIKNYSLSIKKANNAKKSINRFDCNANCKKYFKLITRTINE